MKKKMGEVIRFYHGDRDYPVEKIHCRDGARDLLLFSLKGNVPEYPCVEFSIDEIKQDDMVALLGYSTPILPDKNGILVQFLIKEPGIYAGRISTDAYIYGRTSKSTTKSRGGSSRGAGGARAPCPRKLHWSPPLIFSPAIEESSSFGVAGGLGGAPLFRDGKVIGLHLATFGRNMKDGVSARTMLQVLREWLGVGEDNQATIKELLQMVYDKIESSNVPKPNAEPSNKKVRRMK
ncbi:hypothetical protein PVAP13_2KG375590 [Panicum virgatum]|nr:hypothetical protein PVAP13_2KG375590 [Panicum virgatum]